MPALKLVKGRKVWKVYCEAQMPGWVTTLFGGKMFVSKEAAERFAVRAAIKWPRFFGEISVQEYTCTKEDVSGFYNFATPDRRARRILSTETFTVRINIPRG